MSNKWDLKRVLMGDLVKHPAIPGHFKYIDCINQTITLAHIHKNWRTYCNLDGVTIRGVATQLTMAPKLVKKEYWANKYRNEQGEIFLIAELYDSEESAKRGQTRLVNYIGPALIHSEEVEV